MIQEKKMAKTKIQKLVSFRLSLLLSPNFSASSQAEVGLGWVKGLRQAKCPKYYTNKSVILYKKKSTCDLRLKFTSY